MHRNDWRRMENLTPCPTRYLNRGRVSGLILAQSSMIRLSGSANKQWALGPIPPFRYFLALTHKPLNLNYCTSGGGSVINLQPAPVEGDGRDGIPLKSFLVVHIPASTGLTSLDIRSVTFRWFGKDLRRREGGRWCTQRSPRRVGHESRVSFRVRLQCRRLSNT